MTPAVFFDATSLGIEYSLLAVGIYITFRVLDMADLTVDGSFCLGMAVSAVCTVNGMAEFGLIAGACAGALAGVVTGILATKARINPLIAGIITSTGLYSINVYVLGSPNLSMLGLHKSFDTMHNGLFPDSPDSSIVGGAGAGGGLIPALDISKFIFAASIVAIVLIVLILYFKTASGLAMRAVGDNEQMSAASSINVDAYKIGGLAIGNALVGMTGALLGQCQGFADMTSGTGMVMVGLACVIIGEVCGGKHSVTAGLICSVLGSIIYRIIVQVALGVNLDANSLKLISALIVALFMSVPAVRAYLKERNIRKNAMAGIPSAATFAQPPSIGEVVADLQNKQEVKRD